MADTSKKFSELETATQLDNSDLFAISQSSNGGWVSLKTNLLAIAQKIATGINFTSALQTTDKTLCGAINEAAQSGAIDVIADDFDETQTYAVGDYVNHEGSLYKCTTAVTVAGAWNSANWTETIVMDEIESGGGGGSSTLAGLTDVDLDNLTNGQILVWDNTSEKWVNADNQGGGGGGSGSGFTKTSLYTAAQDESIVSLSQSMANFDLIELVAWYQEGSALYTQNSIYNAQELIDSIGSNPEKRFTVNNDSYYSWYRVNDVDELECMLTTGGVKIKQVYGYKFAGGGSGNANWKDLTGVLTAGQTQITLSDAVISNDSTLNPYTNVFGLKPTNMEIVSGQQTSLQPLVTQESELTVDVSVSSTLSSSYEDWMAFTESGAWVADVSGSNDCWFAVEFPNAVKVTELEWLCADNSRRGTASKLQYSNDGTNWNDCTLTSSTWGHIEVASTNIAKHWRIYFDAPFNTWTEPMIGHLQMYTESDGVRLTFPVQSSDVNVKVRVS